MKILDKTLILVSLAIGVLCSCGEDRSTEFYELTKENQWTLNKMKEVYLWGDSIGEFKQNTYFYESSRFFNQLLYKGDETSFFTTGDNNATYGYKFSLMRDPLGIAPAKVYALVEFVEPGSVASAAGLERGMWISTINGTNINMGTTAALTTGEAVELGVNRIVFDDESEQYIWESLPAINIGAATETVTASLPVTTIISEQVGKIGYMLCNSFDGENSVNEINAALENFASENVANIILDLRYNKSHSINNTAAIAAAFVPAESQNNLFCTLYKNVKLTEKEERTIPLAMVNVSDKPLYIVTTGETTGTANALIKAVRLVRSSSNVKIAGEKAVSTNHVTENFISPYNFEINPVTAIVYDANNEPLAASTPDFYLNEYEDLKHIYPLGNKQEYILYNISYIIANGSLPF